MLSTATLNDVMSSCIQIAADNHTPFGAAIVSQQGEILELASNTGKKDGPLAHAEMNVLKHAHNYSGDIHLVTTCEPCPMCAGAAAWSGISSISYGASIQDAKQFLKQIDIPSIQIIDASWLSIPIQAGIMREKCLDLFHKTSKR